MAQMKRVGAPCELLRIDEIYAYVVKDETGNEGIPGFKTTDGWMPMVGADMRRADQLRPIAQAMADSQGFEIRLCRFTTREEITVFKPQKGRPS